MDFCPYTSTNMSDSLDPPTLLTEMESSTAFSQVVFVDVPRSYPTSTSVTCSYTLTAALQPHPRDWIGLFRVGWNTTQSYHTFVWVEPCLDRLGPEPVTKQVVFNDYYLPKDDGDYQFCYVDNKGQVRGASTPFSFQNPRDDLLYTSLENDLLVISTKEQTEQMEREKTELRQEVEQLKEAKQILKDELDGRLREILSLRTTIEEMKSQSSTSTEAKPPADVEMEQSGPEVMEQSGPEVDAASDVKQAEESFPQSNAPLEEKYDRAVQKINQLKKQRTELKATTENQQAEITQLNSKLKEMEQDLSRLKDDHQLLQVDLQSSQKENEKLSWDVQQVESLKKDLEGLRKENEALHTSMSTQTSQRDGQSSLKTQMDTLLVQLQETRVQLRQEMQGANEARRRADQAEREVQSLRTQLEQTAAATAATAAAATAVPAREPQNQDSALETKLKDALRTIDDQSVIIDLAKEEQEELTKKNQELEAEITLLRGELTRAKAVATPAPATPDPTLYPFPSFTAAATDGGQDSLIFGNPYNPSEGACEDKIPTCQHCLIAFPGLSREDLTQHEESHKVCPMCTLICDDLDQQQFEDHVYMHDL
ncbi:calcium-binding and coiled-coil domain-containing protein 2 [Engraulis encrasicolus]|uniref:calcium-binding and coiled-coil domain-containing protein 2 n=1 Tax=Engraulis encrasicolus TaxID=184585 RepID=UPI002FD58173